MFRACHCLDCTGTSPWFVTSQLTTAGSTRKVGAHHNTRSSRCCWTAASEMLFRACTQALNNVLPTPLHWNKCQICSRATNTNTPSRTWWYFQVKRWIQDRNESAIGLITKNIVLVSKKPHFQSEFIITRSEIQAAPQDQNRKLQSSILSNSSLILISWRKPVENNLKV